jgi:catechol 2,3-dioxygenase-like lactoylglutathione lyase family enzyme
MSRRGERAQRMTRRTRAALGEEAQVLGQFLEFGVSCPDILASLDFYRRLGFADLPVGDIVPTPYAVVALEHAPIGLHAREFPEPTLTFTRPGVAATLALLEARHIEIEFAQLSADSFHCVAVRDPDGGRVLLLEARTFSAAPPPGVRVAVCGRFVEWALPARSLERALEFWTALGFTVAPQGQQKDACARLTGSGTHIGLYEHGRFAPGPRFSCTDLAARLEFLRVQGFRPQTSTPPCPGRDDARLTAPEGTGLYLYEAEP